MHVANRPLVTIAPEGEEIGVHLPRLKNSHLVDDSFVVLGVCTLTPSLRHCFFSGKEVEKKQAKSLCEECPVQDECLEYSIVTEQEWGIWGGLDEIERLPMIRRRRIK